MPKALKYILYSVGGIILILVLLIAGVIIFVDPNDYRERIEQAASDQLGRSVRIRGPMELSFFPWIGLEVQDVSLSNAQGFAPEHMLSVHKAGLKVKLMPLISREVQVGTLLLEQAEINLAKNAKGQTNWEDLMPENGQSPGEPRADSEEDKESTGSSTGLAALSIEKIEIQDTSLNWSDKMSGTQTQIRDLGLEVGPVNMDSPIPFRLSCAIDNTQPEVQAEVSTTGQAEMDMQKKVVHINDLDVQTLASGPDIPGGEAKTRLQTSLSLNLDSEYLEVPDMSLTAFDDLRITAQAEGESVLSDPRITGTINVEQFNPLELMTRLDLPQIKTRDPKALSSVQAQTQFTATPSSLQLTSLDMVLDDTSIQGQAAADLRGSVPASSFDLRVDQIDVDRYLPPAQTNGQAKTDPQEEDKKKADKGQEKEASAAALPLAPLRQLNMDGQIQVQKMKVKGMRMEEVALTIQAKDGQIDISPLQGRLYGGTLESTTSLDVRGQTPKVDTKTRLDTIQMESLLQDMTGKSLLSGLGSVQTSFSSQGLDARSLLQALNGSLDLDLQEGSFQGADLLHRIRTVYLTMQGKTPKETETESTKFSSLDFDADIAQGMVRKSNLKLISSLFSMQGSGQIDLIKRSLDYLLQMNFDRDLSGQYPELSDLEGKEIPIDVRGSFADPRLGLNKETLVRILGQEKMSEEVDKGMQKLQEKLGLSGSEEGNETSDTGQKAKDALKSLFGGDKKE
ncbi:MAG: AsmA family protein [Desulfovermiculus sp.]